MNFLSLFTASSAKPADTSPATPVAEASTLSRRRVFAGAGAVGALAAVAAALPSAPVAPTPVAAALPDAVDDADGRYQVTAHVQRYYRSAQV